MSVGSVGSVPGFSTISVREPIAQKILDYIKKQGYAEFGEGDPGQLGFLVGHKKKRAENLKK